MADPIISIRTSIWSWLAMGGLTHYCRGLTIRGYAVSTICWKRAEAAQEPYNNSRVRLFLDPFGLPHTAQHQIPMKVSTKATPPCLGWPISDAVARLMWWTRSVNGGVTAVRNAGQAEPVIGRLFQPASRALTRARARAGLSGLEGAAGDARALLQAAVRHPFDELNRTGPNDNLLRQPRATTIVDSVLALYDAASTKWKNQNLSLPKNGLPVWI